MKTYTPAELQEVIRLHGAYLRVEVNGSRADLSRADLSGANLSGADLSWADLSGADLSWANLSGANLSWASLSGANLSRADLSRADLSWANLSGADLSRANLSGANLSRANLSGANLSGANLSWASLSGASLSRAKWNADSYWPAITAVLLASWGEVSDDLCRDMMRYDACNHPDPSAFDRWVAGGPCPYGGVRIQRAANFVQKAHLWSPGPVKPYDIFQRLLAEKLVRAE